MSGLDRMRAEKRRLRKGGKFNPDEVYASIPCTHLHAAAQVLTPIAFRAFWLANANWCPAARDGDRGRAVLAYSMIRWPLGQESARSLPSQPGPSAIAAGIREACSAGFLDLAAAGTRPLKQGGSRGVAAEYFVPCRGAGAALPKAAIGMPRIEGKVRMHSIKMRLLAASLSPNALKILGLLISQRHRNRAGELIGTAPIQMGVRMLTELTQIKRSSAAAAVKELEDAKHLVLEKPKQGSRAAAFQLHRQFHGFTKIQNRDRPLPALSQ